MFTAWGMLVGLFAVLRRAAAAAPARHRPALYLNLALFAIDVLVIAVFIHTRRRDRGVIVSGAFIGTNNTITTQAVMTVAPVERPIASAVVRLHPLHRRRHRAVGRRQDRRRPRRPPALLHRRGRDRRLDRSSWPPATGCSTSAEAAQAADALHHARPRVPEPLDSEADLLLDDEEVGAGR